MGPGMGMARYRPSHHSGTWSWYQGEAGLSLWPPGYTPSALPPAGDSVTIIRQLGPVVAVSPPSAASGVNGSPPAARGPYPRPFVPLSEGNARECNRPQVHSGGVPPSTDDRCAPAASKLGADRATSYQTDG